MTYDTIHVHGSYINLCPSGNVMVLSFKHFLSTEAMVGERENQVEHGENMVKTIAKV